MNLRIRRLSVALSVLYLVLFLQLNRVQFFGAERLQDDVNNTRGLIREFGRARGPIITADGVLVARSVEYDGSVDFRREYPEGELYAHITGYQSLNVEAVGLERSYNDELAGDPIDQRFASLGDLFVDRNSTATLTLSIRDDVQRVAAEALGDRKGSVVALDPRTGEIIALWTFPSFDPNPLADPDGTVANAAFDALVADPNTPLLAKSYREIYFPGSTFKLVTAAAGVETGLIGASTPVFPVATTYEPVPAGAPIRNFAGSACGGDLVELLRVSCNTAFSEIGAEWVGPERWLMLRRRSVSTPISASTFRALPSLGFRPTTANNLPMSIATERPVSNRSKGPRRCCPTAPCRFTRTRRGLPRPRSAKTTLPQLHYRWHSSLRRSPTMAW